MIDPGIAELCRVLNARGQETVWSCSGLPSEHPDSNPARRVVRMRTPGDSYSTLGYVSIVEKNNLLLRVYQNLRGTLPEGVHIRVDFGEGGKSDGSRAFLESMEVECRAPDTKALEKLMRQMWNRIQQEVEQI